MLYDLKFHLSQRYDTPVQHGRHALRVAPAHLPGLQHVSTCHISAFPIPAEMNDWLDFFGNRVSEVRFSESHDQLDVEARARIERFALCPPDCDRSTPLSLIDQAAAVIASVDPQSPHHFVPASRFAWPFEAARAFALREVTWNMPTHGAVIAIGEALNREIRFDAHATDVDTSVEDAFARRVGVCQDISHIMIACLRALGIPAGYVSGYLRTIPPPGFARLEGADAMHAWVRAWGGAEVGWMEYDPTNASIVGKDHIVVGYGRDYGDVAPVIGALRSAGGQSGRHTVDVIPVT